MSARTIGLAFALGGAGALLLDPQNGRGRRARLRDHAIHELRELANSLDIAVSDLAHRSHGAIAAARSWLHEEPPSDTVIAERVRTRLGRAGVHARAFTIVCSGGRVVLKGDVLEVEAGIVLEAVQTTPGVLAVVDELTRHALADVPRLQGLPRGARRRNFNGRWRPATRLVIGGAGALVALTALRARSPGSSLGLLLGGGALVRSVANRRLSDLVGMGVLPVAPVSLRKSLHVRAPIERVYSVATDFEKLPRFMAHVIDVQKRGDDRYRATTAGLGGVSFDWTVSIRERVENARVVFDAESPFATVEGILHFEPREDRSTSLTFELSYHPPLGEVGRAIASVVEAGAKREIDADLLRLKSLLEQGKARGRHGAITLGEILAGLGGDSALHARSPS